MRREGIPVMWERIWKVAKVEWNRTWWGLLASMLFVAYMALVSSLAPSETDSDWEVKLLSFLQDVTALGAFSVMGFAISRDYLNFKRNRPFTKRLAVLSCLPIRSDEIVYARYMVAARNVAVSGTTFFTLQYWISDEEVRVQLPGFEFVQYALLLLGFVLFLTSAYLCLEMGQSEKRYRLSCFVIGIGMILLLGVFAWLLDFSVVAGSKELVRDYGWAASALSMVLGITASAILARMTVRILDNRDLA